MPMTPARVLPFRHREGDPMPLPTPVRPTSYDIARDRLRRLGLLAFSLKRHHAEFHDAITPGPPVTCWTLLGNACDRWQAWWRARLPRC